MSRGLGVIQQAIIDVLKKKHGSIDPVKLRAEVAILLVDQGTHVCDESPWPPESTSEKCVMIETYGNYWITDMYRSDFYRSLNSLERRKLIKWKRSRGQQLGIVSLKEKKQAS